MISLPSGVYPAEFEMALVDLGGVQRSGLGGAGLRVNRLGNHYRALVTLPPLETALGKQVISRLTQAKSAGLRLAIPDCSGKQGSPGTSILVNGAGQAGQSIGLDGFPPGYVGQEGYWLSINDGTQNYVHQVSAAFTANGSGQATVFLTVALRKVFADNAAVSFAAPTMDGFVIGDEQTWSISLARHYGISFAIEEAR